MSFLLLKWRKYRIYGLPRGFGGLKDRNEIALKGGIQPVIKATKNTDNIR